MLIGGVCGLLVPQLMSWLLPTGINLATQAGIVFATAYTSSDFVNNMLAKFGVGPSPAPLREDTHEQVLVPKTGKEQP